MSVTTDTITVVGIADCHGIESIRLKDQCDNHQMFCLQLRSQSNRQRHAIYYEAEMSQRSFDRIIRQLETGEYIKALNLLKENAVSLSNIPGQENSWDLIPNPDLDPWG